MHIDEIQTDPEFEALFADTRLSGVDLEHLTNKLLTEGFHDPLVLWNGVLLDGYTRLGICRENGIEPKVRSVELSDRDHAVEWIRLHQHSRRNLDAKARALNIAEVYEGRKRRHGDRGPEKTDNDYQSFSAATREAVAAEFNVSPATVQRALEYKRGLDAIEAEGGAEAREKAESLPMETIIEQRRPSKQRQSQKSEPPHKAVVAKLLEMAKPLDASEKVSLARELFRIARKWGLQRR